MYSAGTVRLRLTISISGAGGGREVVQGATLNSHHSQAGRVAARFVAWLAAWWVGGLVGWLLWRSRPAWPPHRWQPLETINNNQ